jgi:hypothetical protein
MRQSGKRFHKTNEVNTSTQKLETLGSLKGIEKTESHGFAKKEQRAVEVSVGEEPLAKIEVVQPAVKKTVDLTSLMGEQQDLSMSSSRVFEKQLAQQKGIPFVK